MRILIHTAMFMLTFAVFAAETEEGGKNVNTINTSTGDKVTAKNVILSSVLDLNKSGLEATRGNDIWGWTDSLTGKEYAIMGLDSKTSFVDVTDAANPIHVADIATRTQASIWRDIKVYKNYAYIVSEAYRHGMQVVDLHKLREFDGKEVMTLESDLDYTMFGNAHNVAINEETGYIYAVGTSTCDGGLHVIDARDPLNLKFVTCVGRNVYEVPENFKKTTLRDGEAYTHDVQCVVYKGADTRFLGREICVASNEDTVNVVDVTDKNNPVQISVASYKGVNYTHQGWLSEDQNFFFLGDELDETDLDINTKTFIWDMRDLTQIKQHGDFVSSQNAIDHNMYSHNGYMYQANYTAGLRILDISDVENMNVKEVAWLDTMPENNKAEFAGVWSVFPYYKSGTVVVSGINGTLYVTKPELERK